MGNTVEQCTEDGEWQALPAAEQCGAGTPACTGAGICAAYRLVDGTIDTFGIYPPEANGPTYILKRQTFIESRKICSATYCVTGGVRP